MDICKPNLTNQMRQTPPDVVVGEGDPGRQSEPEPVARSSVEPDPGPGRTCSAHEAEASWSTATATGAVFGPQLPVGSVGVSVLCTDKPKQVELKKYPVKMFD